VNNVIVVFKKELKLNFRAKTANIMLILFPIVLIIILGMAFSSSFGANIQLDEVKVLYTDQGSLQLSNAFKEFIEQGKKMGIQFKEIDDVQAGLESIKQAEYSCYVLLKEDASKIELYKNDRHYFVANLVEAILRTFVDRYNVIAGIAGQNPAMLKKIMEENAVDFLDVKSLGNRRKPGSTDYYSVTMLTMIILYSSFTGLWNIKNEQNLKTGSRVLCGPIKKHEFLLGKVMGSIGITIIQGLTVLFFSKWVLNAYWGTNIMPIIAVVVSEAVMAVSVGVGVAFSIKREAITIGIINLVVPVMVALGGGYFPLEELGGILGKLSVISPVRWMNRAIFNAIYNNDFSLIPVAIIINLIIASLFIGIASAICRKEEIWQ